MEIKLSRKVPDHIVARHPEVAAYTHKIVETVQKAIITAYFTSNVAKVKGEVIWKKSQ